ncbi:MAG: hypothetical protein QXQ50_06660 [Candidatus Bathyarchaeia archaeon]
MKCKGQFSLIAALLVAVILIATVIITYSVIRTSPVSDMPQVLSAIDETNLALRQVLGFTIGYYGSVLKVTGNVTYARILAEKYLCSGLIHIANMHPDWGTSFNVEEINLQTRWFEKVSYSGGDLAVSYNLTGLGIYGISYKIACKLTVNVTGSSDNKAYLKIEEKMGDDVRPVTKLGKSNFNFYRYNYSTSTWELVGPSNEPEATSDGLYSIDLPFGVDSDSFMIQVEDQRGILVTAASFTRYTYTLAWNPNATLINGESFEGVWPPSGWTATGIWTKTSIAYKGNYSAGFVVQGKSESGILTTSALNCSDASAIYIEFWYRNDGCSSGEFLLEYYNGAEWRNITDLGTRSSGMGWLCYRQKITDSQYFKHNFQVRWRAVDVDSKESVYVDYVTIKKEVNLLKPNEPIVVELLQNGTMRWLGQNLMFMTQTKPIPPIPVKSIRVNQTINGVNREVPFQIEDWASDYKVPLGLTNNASLFSNRNMIVFLINKDVSKITVWWNGSDKATQTPYAYVNRYFNDQPPDVGGEIGTLSNRLLTLTIDASGNSFLVKSRVTTTGIEVTARFMRANNEWSVYGSNPAYAIYNGIVRDIVHAEAEWEKNPPRDLGGIPDCANVYSHIIIMLPANATYYTYQLRLIFLESSGSPRTITDLCPIRISTTASGQFSALTENGTLGLYPRVSTTSNTLFYNMSNVWQHRWSQLWNQSLNRGFGIMFPIDSNVRLYYFDSMASDKTGCLNVSISSSIKFIELSPVKRFQVYGFTSSLDICWYGAVVTFDNTTPVYHVVDGVPTGLWILVAYPPVVSLVAEG